MNNAIFNFIPPENEPLLDYLKESKERKSLLYELNRLQQSTHEIPCIIGGKEYFTGDTSEITLPHNHKKSIGKYHKASEKEIDIAIKSALEARKVWSGLSWTIRASILLKAAELISTKYRYLINAATMLGQSKNIYQSEIEAVCETIDFLKHNAYFATKIYETQPKSHFNQLNKMEFRPLEGFVFTVSPFNFTAIAANLNMAPVMMGNTTVWKPASTAILSNYYLMKIFMEAGMPEGVINFIPGKGSLIGEKVLNDPLMSGVHFTGSNNTFNSLWSQVTQNLTKYRSYPRLVGETGGKDFIFVHPSADPHEVAVNTIRGAFEYQGQKCSAVSRMYIPSSLWLEIKDLLLDMCKDIKLGDVMDPDNFMNAVIDEKAFDNIADYIEYARKSVDICDNTSLYGLTGAVFSKDRIAASKICEKLRYAAGNFYINDKPTGAIVGLQPFGGSRASGTNDKAGAEFNLIRWISPRTIKETFMPATDYRYNYMLNK